MHYGLLLLFSILSFSQNSYQNNLYDLDKQIKIMEKKLKNEVLTYELLNEKLDLIKSINRLSEQALSDSLDDFLSVELGELIFYTCEYGKLKLDLLQSYRNFKNEFYLNRYNEVSSIYLSFFFKVKTKE